MGESVQVRCPECLRTQRYAPPAFPCVCGTPIAPPVTQDAPAEPVTHRNWAEEWVTVLCPTCARPSDWPHPELGCACGAVLRVPVRGMIDAGMADPGMADPGTDDAGTDEGLNPDGGVDGDGGAGPDPGPGPNGDSGRDGSGSGSGGGNGPEAAVGPTGTGPGSGSPVGPGSSAGPRSDRTPAHRTPQDTAAHGGESPADTGPPGAGGAPPAPEAGHRPAVRSGSALPRPTASPGPGPEPGHEPDGYPSFTERHPAPWAGSHPDAHPGAHPAHPALPARPAFRPVTIRTARDAVAASAGYLRWLGFRDVVQPEERSAVAVDLRGPGLVAQVDPSTRPTGLRAVECLWLNGLSNGSTSVCFSLAGYTPEAHERAEGLGIPLFVLDLTGTPQPVNAPADLLIDTGAA